MFGIGQSIRRKPRQFSYNPRYYDAEQEARNQRRVELGHAPRNEEKKEYTPGDILRARSEQRARKAEQDMAARKKSNNTRLLFAALLIVGLVLLVRSIMNSL